MLPHIDLDRAFRLFPSPALRQARIENPLQIPFLFLAGFSPADAQPGAGETGEPLCAADVDLAYRLILQRRPESSEPVQQNLSTAKSPFEVASRLLCSAEWAQRVNEFFRVAFPTVRRLWHIHAPKTGGSAFFDTGCRAGWGYIHLNLLDLPGRSLQATADAVRYIEGKNLLVSGHRMAWQVQTAIGPFDTGIMFVRDPLSRAVSYYNFASDLVAGRENVHKGDTKFFFDTGFDPSSFEKTHLAGFFVANEMCLYLSQNRSCREALRTAEACGIELALMEDVSEQCIRFFGLPAEIVNKSTGALKAADIRPDLAEAIIAENAEDVALHAIVRARRLRAKATTAPDPARPA